MKGPLVQENKRLCEVCTFGIGGPARYFFEVRTCEEAKEALAWAQEKRLPFHVLGKGSNTLFDDRGYSGVVILNKIDFFKEISPGLFHVGGGYSFSLLGAQTARKGWSGLEFASGIPASVGGAVYMNAGANGCETADTLESVDFLSADGKIETLSKAQVSFAYRTSSFQKLSGIILGATFQLSHQPQARTRQLEIVDYRKRTQPGAEKSAGCAFRNPQDASAGRLIEMAGLKGVAVGGAKISEKHANFIVNTGNATCAEILKLVAFIQEKVKESTGIELEHEIRWIPYENE